MHLQETRTIMAPEEPSKETSMHVIAATFGTGEVFWSMLWFFLWFIWIWLLIVVFSDIFRSHDLSGWAKALWILFVVVVPYLGVLVYMIARGHKMTEHAQEAAAAQDAAARQYIQSAVASTSPADELAKLADLKSKGMITEDDFNQAKAKILA
jgi:hypothetical protein